MTASGGAASVEPQSDGAGNALQRGRDGLRAWLLRQRRRRASKGRGTGRRARMVLLAALVLLLALFAYSLVYLEPKPLGQELSLDELSALADAKRIETAEFLDEDSLVTGTFTAPAPVKEASDRGRDRDGQDRRGGEDKRASGGDAGPQDGTGAGKTAARQEPAVAPPGSGRYWLAYPSSDAMTAVLVQMMTSAGARVTIDPQPTKQAVRIVTTFLLPLMILAALFALLFTGARGGGSGIGEVMTFGTIGGRRYKKGAGPRVSFADVAGAEEAVAELKEVRDYLRNPRKYAEVGAAPPKGVLLVGPPGCGKTLLAKAVAGEAGVPFFSVAGAEFVESLVGVGAARVRDLFQRVRAVAPAIVFIDELDAAGRRRGTGGGSGGSDEREQTLNQMLVEMDGFEVSQGIVVIGATNRPDILDPALLRPGRFDRHVTMDQPDQVGRQEILELHARGKRFAADVDFELLAKRTPGFSGADLANVINEAALLSLREGKPQIEMPELVEAIQRVLAGPKKKGRVLSPEEKERAAYHESGHAVIAAALGRAEDVHRVSILARGRGLGLATLRRETDAVLLTRSELFSQIVTAFGGLAAEVLVLREPSTGAEQDLERATELARDMIGRFGMGTRRQRLLSKDVDEFIGNEAGVSQLSPKTHEEMEREVDRVLAEAERLAGSLLRKNRPVLDQLAQRLQSEEHLEGRDLDALLRTVPVHPISLDGSWIAGNGARASKARTEAR